MSNANREAFPVSYNDMDSVSGGLSKREYVAIHAPGEIPDWFVHNMRSIPAKPRLQNDATEEDSELVNKWHREDIFDLPEHLQWYQKEWSEYWDEKSKWEKDNNIERYFQWRKYYADELLKQLEAE